MKTQIKQMLKRFVSSVLSVSMLTPMLQAPSYAAAEVRIPEIEIDDGILTSDVFYLTAANAQLEEGSNARYLLRVARGGEADTDAGVTLKIADLTAKYGEDYTISLYGSGTNADSPKSNQSLLERIEGEAYTQSELRTEEEYSQMMEDDPDLREQTAAAMQQAVDYIEQASGLAGKQTDDSERASGSEDGAEQEIPFADEEPSAEGDTAPQEEQTADGADGPETEPSAPTEEGDSEAEPSEPAEKEDSEANPSDPTEDEDSEANPSESAEAPNEKPAGTTEGEYAEPSDGSEEISTDPLQEARRMYTGISGEPQRVTSTMDTMQQIQKIANVVTSAVVGATLTIDFAAGESEKYIAIDVKDNHVGDGDRYFYLMLAEPYGTTTNSAASSCAVTIVDDEKQAPSKIGFSESRYAAEGESVTVEITRSGALNTIAAAHLTTEAGTAQAGRDFSPVDMDIVFPIGIEHQTVEIPIRTGYIVGSADFGLKLDTVENCDISRGSAAVEITGAAGMDAGADAQPGENGISAQSEEDGIMPMAIEESGRVSDIVLGDPIGLSSPVKTGNNDHFGGRNYYDSNGNNGKGEWVEQWADNYSGWKHFWGTKATGSTGASWTLGYLNRTEKHSFKLFGRTYSYETKIPSNGADLAGVQVDWARSGDHANISAFFVGSGSRDIDWNYRNGERVYDSRSYFGDGTKTNLFCTYWDPVRVSILNYGNCEDCGSLWIHSIRPIYRPFVVNLQDAEPLTFLNADGSRSAWKDATYLALAGANNMTNNQVIRYSKEGKNAVTFQQTVGGNVQTPYTYLKNVRVVKDRWSKNIVSYGNDGGTSHTFTMNTDWVCDNASYIYFEENNSSNAWKNQTGTFGLRGRIELKPEFGYKDATVKVNVPANNFGYFRISGSNKNIDRTQTYTYHRGDILKLSTVMRSQYKDSYEPAGYMVSYKHNQSDTRWVKQNVIVPYGKDNGTSEFLDDNQRLRYGYYEITPLFQRTGNAVMVRVKNSDLSNIDTSYGFFKSALYTEKKIGNEMYREYVVYENPDYGKIYSLAARLSSTARSNVYLNWTVPGNNRNYGGEVFYHEASNNLENNIITLSCVTENYPSAGGKDVYQTVEGSLYRPVYNMQTKQTSMMNMHPARGALVSFGSSFAVVDEDGSFKLTPFRAMNDYKGSPLTHYIRYMVSVNGETSLREMALPQSSGSSQEVSVIQDGSGTDSIKKVQAWVSSQSLGQQLISTENGSIINHIDVTTDNASYGYNIIIDGDRVTVRAKMREPVLYTKVTTDAGGRLTEQPNTPERVTGVKFVIYDAYTNTEKAAYDAAAKDGGFAAEIPLSEALPGNRLYLRVTTDRSHGIYAPGSAAAEMNRTTYSDVFTGYTFLQKTTEKVPVLQHVELPIDMNFENLPLLGDTAMQFDLPFVSVGSVKTDTGYRLYIGVSVGQVADKIKDSHMTSYAGDTGAYYKDIFSIKHPIQTFKEGLAASYKDAFKNVPTAFDGATSALGAPTWKFDVQVGVYFDFTYMSISNPNNGANDTACIFTGVGGYIGVSAGVKMAWYTILPVVWIPAYFGIDISGNVLGFFGAGTDTSKPQITYDAANNATVNFDDKLGEFHASVKMAATVQVYVGVGLAGTIGLRGGGTFSAMGLWEPSDWVSDWGGDLQFTAGIWIDLFLFSVPLQYSFPDIKLGSFKQYENLSGRARMLSDGEEPAEFEVRQPYTDAPSEWLPDGAQTRSAFSEVSTQTIVKNAYEHPDAQLAKLKNGSVFMAFLDTDPARDATQRTVLKYAVYRNGAWSDPRVVQDDGTADFQPSICEMDGGKVMISWLSSDPENAVPEDSGEYLANLEVYTAVIDPASGTVSEETRLTTDEYYDYTPTSVYDEKTGDRIVYYVKTAEKGSAADMVNSYANDCVIVYMLYSNEKGKWMFDEYYPNEVDSPESEEILIEKWHGQRFLAAAIPELGKDNPNIADFTAISYNGIAVYAYTIDQDSSNDTAFDKELFLQCYNFATHSTYVPIRITNDSVSDALPQFVRTGESFNEAAKTDADTKLFWYRDEKNIAYIDVSSLVRDGVNDDGTINPKYLTSPDGEVKSLDSLYSYVSVAVDNPQGSRSMADFKAVTDGDDIYIVWTQPVSTVETDEDGNYKQCREVYATALVQDENPTNPGRIEGEIPSGAEAGDNADETGASWADPYRLTYTDAFTDEPSAVIDNSGHLMVLYNSYNQTLTGDERNPVAISDFKLNASYMEPCGAVEVTSIAFSNTTPNPGDTVEVMAAVKNAGLTAANGYTVNIYEMKDSTPGTLVKTISSAGRLLPGNTNAYTFEWTAPASVDGISFYAEAKEGGMNNTSTFESEKLEVKPVYQVDDLSVYQDGNGFHLTCNVTNHGNAAGAAGDTLDVIFSGPYAMAADYTLAECDFGKESLAGIGIGESKALTIDLNTIPEAFNKYGFLDCLVVGKNSDGEYLTEGEEIRLVPSQPVEVLLNGKPFPEEIVLSADGTMEFEITCEPKKFADGMKAVLGTDDTAIAVFDGTTLKGLSEGTTVMHGTLMPYGAPLPEIPVRITGSSSTHRPNRRPSGGSSSSSQQTVTAEPVKPETEPETAPEPQQPSGSSTQTADVSQFSDIQPSDWFHDSVAYVVSKGYFAGTNANSFSPNTNVTRGMLVTVLGRLDGITETSTVTSFRDVPGNMYYAAHIAWASEKGIVSGYGPDRFGPDDEVTREQLAVMIAKFLTYKTGITAGDTALAYSDADEISSWAKAAVALATQQGILSGNGHGGFAPQNHATRAEIAVVIQKLDALLANQKSSTEGGNS